MRNAEALDRAADIIEHQGFTRGDKGTRVGEGPKCALGAISQAVGHGVCEGHYATYQVTDAPEAAVEFVRYIMEKTPSPWDEVSAPVVTMSYAWNFNDGHTAEEVVAELRACALIEATKAEVEEKATA